MILPKKGKEVSLETVKDICERYELLDLLVKLKRRKPKKPFMSDG